MAPSQPATFRKGSSNDRDVIVWTASRLLMDISRDYSAYACQDLSLQDAGKTGRKTKAEGCLIGHLCRNTHIVTIGQVERMTVADRCGSKSRFHELPADIAVLKSALALRVFK